MITRQDLDSAIAECQGERSPNANTCIKLAAFYTIREHLYPERSEMPYSYAPAPDTVVNGSGSEFAELTNGKPQSEVWSVIEELLYTIKVLHPRLYDAVISKLS